MTTKIYLQAFIMMIVCSLAINTYAQEQKSAQKSGALTEMQRQKEVRNFYRKTLGVDSVKAVQVSHIQDAYKTAMRAVIADTSLNEAAKRVRMTALMDTKNRQLRSLLSPAQQEKIIPSTEREPSKAAGQH